MSTIKISQEDHQKIVDFYAGLHDNEDVGDIYDQRADGYDDIVAITGTGIDRKSTIVAQICNAFDGSDLERKVSTYWCQTMCLCMN